MPNPSAWIRRHAGLIPNLDNGASVLDLACGSGRHVRWLAARGAQVTAVDRDAAALATLHGVAAEVMLVDIENGPWPLPGRTFDAVVVTNYLWRPLLPAIVASVAPGGVLLYETFAHGNASVGKPSRPDFLLQPGELLDRVRPELRVVAYEDGFLDSPPRFVQRIAAVRQTIADTSANPERWPLPDS
ncbi:class I SAM-dependent methyltransferase [Sphaerotilus montanus]|uniref:SAM-dependent methyltransferase n=1 Tax=Sphaerotilus montanus TaxID=522889 RepID=A0A7Y9U6V4_9BURK|nr:class I SAM-dependent methyltransferase [Sphaerotilus montanus]NYG34453.1 SAM-dependent methyltransferase [Sphaerotilus montanus]NZD55695.1 class I SAM-dependent methyltransferase [Sphaerotilus montanus]